MKMFYNYMFGYHENCGTICLTYALLFFLDSANEIYQTLKDIYSAKAFFMLALFMFIAQRVRLFNWQSLVAILLYTPVGLAYRNMRAESPDLFARDKVVVWTFGILLLIVVDMIVYKKVNPLARFHNPSLILFSLMAVAMIFHRGDRQIQLFLK